MQKQNRYHTNYQEVFKGLPDDRRGQALDLARIIAEGRNDPVVFGEKLLGLRFHAKQKIWLWLTTKTQIDKAYELAGIINYPLPDKSIALTHEFLKNILCPSNRFGKTFVTAVKHVWYNFYKIGMSGEPKNIALARYQTLNLSPHSMQVDALYRYIVDFFQETFVYEWDGKKVRNVCRIKEFMLDHLQVKREVVFANNSMVKGAPTGDDQASSIAGTNFYYISYDEAPQSIHLRSELPAKILSRLIDSGGPLDLIGTPEVDKPSHQYYSRVVKFGLTFKEGWFTLLGSLDENEFIPDEQKNRSLEAIRTTDPEKYRQVRFGEFISSGSKLFPPVVIEKLWEGRPEAPKDGHKYLQVTDWGFSDTGDPTLIYIFDYTPLVLSKDEFIEMYGPGKVPRAKVVFRERIKGGSPYEALARSRILQEEYNDTEFLHDANSMGGVMLKKMLRELKVRHIHDFITTDRASKEEMLFLTARAMSWGRKTDRDDEGRVIEKTDDFGKIRSFLIPELEEQLGTYKVDDKKLEQDEVMCFCMGVWFIEKKIIRERVPVYNFNILAPRPEQIIGIPQKKQAEVKTRVINIREKIIG